MPELILEKGNVPKSYQGAWFENSSLNLTIHFPDGPVSTMIGVPSSSDAGRSLTADLLIIDEWLIRKLSPQDDRHREG